MNKEAFIQQYCEKFQKVYGKTVDEGNDLEHYTALAGLVRDLISLNWIKTNKYYDEHQEKQVFYFSIEFLLGKLLSNNLANMGIKGLARKAMKELNIDFDTIIKQEPDAGLGNGGLGRLAACFMDSIASLGFAGHGCGIRYKYGFFKQKIINGYQVELPDNWLENGNVWEIRKPDKAVEVRFGGHVRIEQQNGKILYIHENYEPVKAVPYDIPLVGYRNNIVNTLRLWNAEIAEERDHDLSSFNREDHLKAAQYKDSVERISRFLYPDDSNLLGRELRLKQQYFLVSAGIQSILHHYKKKNGSLEKLDEKIVFHINDTHPVLAIPELMRILIDEEGMGWDEAWQITNNMFAFTNHTVLPESLEKWPVDLFRSLLPRIYMIVEEINKRFCQELCSKYPGDWERVADMAIIAEGQIRMTTLAVVSCFSVNGVANIHTEILKRTILKNFNDYYPHKINNKTNGITHRRWCIQANPGLTKLILDTLGASCIKHPTDLTHLLKFADDRTFQEKLALVKQQNKEKVAQMIYQQYNIALDTHSIFDMHIKRIHMYKRQLLNIFHILDLYHRLKEDPDMDIQSRTFFFGGKAAPSYYLAKNVIKLINDIANLINHDKAIKDKLKVVFLENYNVSLAEYIIPAADVSEQISTASKEASGTGNMKFMMNGAITIGTLDGANIEIRNEVGPDNMFIFGMTAEEVLNYYQFGGYDSWEYYHNDVRLKWILDNLVSGTLSLARDEFKSIHDSLLYDNDEYFVLKDFASYVDAQKRLEQTFRDQKCWQRMSVMNIANSGIFSSDRTILEYALGIWNIKPVIK